MAANMLESVDGEEWTARGLSKGDVMFALALGSIHLRINSIELGLKHILDREMGRPVPQKHDLVLLWNRLTDEWKEKVAEASCVPMGDIREALGQYKDAAVALRYGGSLGEQTAQSPVPDTMRKHAAVLQKLANTLGGRAHPAIALRKVEPRGLTAYPSVQGRIVANRSFAQPLPLGVSLLGLVLIR